MSKSNAHKIVSITGEEIHIARLYIGTANLQDILKCFQKNLTPEELKMAMSRFVILAQEAAAAKPCFNKLLSWLLYRTGERLVDDGIFLKALLDSVESADQIQRILQAINDFRAGPRAYYLIFHKDLEIAKTLDEFYEAGIRHWRHPVMDPHRSGNYYDTLYGLSDTTKHKELTSQKLASYKWFNEIEAISNLPEDDPGRSQLLDVPDDKIASLVHLIDRGFGEAEHRAFKVFEVIVRQRIQNAGDFKSAREAYRWLEERQANLEITRLRKEGAHKLEEFGRKELARAVSAAQVISIENALKILDHTDTKQLLAEEINEKLEALIIKALAGTDLSGCLDAGARKIRISWRESDKDLYELMTDKTCTARLKTMFSEIVDKRIKSLVKQGVDKLESADGLVVFCEVYGGWMVENSTLCLEAIDRLAKRPGEISQVYKALRKPISLRGAVIERISKLI